MKLRIGCVMVALLSLVLTTAAQTAGSSPASAQVPLVMNFSGVLADVNGRSLTGVVGVTFSLYEEQQGGSPLWLETQNVQVSKMGSYTVALGSASSEGLPASVFAAGEARWLGVRPQGQEEQPRVLLMSVPYALKALDAETLGGRPASAFLAATGASGSPAGNVTGSGTKNFIPRWSSTSQIGNSNIFESTLGQVGIATTTPAAKLDVNGNTAIRNTLTLFPNGANETLRVSGSAFAISSAGKVTFISGQNFPGTGTITGVTAGSGLTGGGTSGKVTLGLISSCSNGQILQWNGTKWVCSNAGTGTVTGITAQAPITGGGSGGNVKIGLTSSCSSGEVLRWNGSTWACSSVGSGTITEVTAGTDLTGGGTSGNVTLNLDTTKVPTLAANNTFTGSQQLFNNTVIVGPITGATEGQLAAGSPSVDNPAFGAAGFSAALGSGGSGGDAIVSFGGSGDIETNNGNTGAGGIFAEGGAGSAGGAGIFALGGGAEEGGCCADGPGGYFEGGSNNFSGDGIDALSGGGWAGNFSGNLNVTGAIFAGTKDFKIDHPLDPANKYLLHASVESSEMMNIYSGNVITDGQGEAVVHLPNWFEVLNTDFRYQLTVIGQFAQAIVAREIQNGEFSIRTSSPDVKVSWQITGVRHDAYAKAHPLVVEEQKDARLRGFYIHPELYGAPAEKQIEWARHPALMRQAKEGKLHVHPAVKAANLAKSVPSSR